jgi:hypothetical protein
MVFFGTPFAYENDSGKNIHKDGTDGRNYT